MAAIVLAATGMVAGTARASSAAASKPCGTTAAAPVYQHYSLLGTAEALLGLPKLGQAAPAATMTAAFNL